VLYIGIEKYRMVFVKNFLWHGYKMDILEIWKPHIDYYREVNSNFNLFNKIVHGDVREVDKYSELDDKYDVVFWFHGPEHIMKKELPDTIEKLKQKTGKLLIMACPYGESHSPARGGNVYNEHVAELYTEDFYGMYLEVVCEQEKRIKVWWRNDKN
jgi:hypothetical protein